MSLPQGSVLALNVLDPHSLLSSLGILGVFLSELVLARMAHNQVGVYDESGAEVLHFPHPPAS